MAISSPFRCWHRRLTIPVCLQEVEAMESGMENLQE